MRFACATAGVLVIATVSQAAPSPWKASRSTERAEGVRFVSAAGQMMKRSRIVSTVDKAEDWNSSPVGGQSELNNPLANPIQTKHQKPPPKEDSESSGRVHAYSEPEGEAPDQRLALPLEPFPAAPEKAPKKDSGPNGRVHAYSQEDEEEDNNNMQRLALPTSSTDDDDTDEPADPAESQADSGSEGRVHEYSQSEEAPKERHSQPLRAPLGRVSGGQRDAAAPTTPTDILLQAIAEYQGALVADDGDSKTAGPGRTVAAASAGATAALPDHTIEPFPLLKYQTRPVRDTIHRLSNNTFHIDQPSSPTPPAIRSAHNLTDPPSALPNISSLANNSPVIPSLLPQTPSPPGLANLSSLSNNSHP